MPQTTEAACLLESGASYPRRVGLATREGGVILAGVKPGGVSLYFGDAPIYHFDLDGRYQRAFVEGTHYLKGLDGTVRSIDRGREEGGMVLRRDTLPYAAVADLDASIRAVALELIDDLDSARLAILPPPAGARSFAVDDLREFLERVALWDSAAWFAHRERYLGTYGPPPFLPPDCPNALILQATLGHADGRAFGGAKPAEHYLRSSREFLDHARAVAALTGRRIAQHRGVFLGGADVLLQPPDDVLDRLATIASVLPIGDEGPTPGDAWDDFPARLGPVHAFLDEFGPNRPDLDGWRGLRAAGLGRVTLGVESGDPAIRSGFGRAWSDGDLRAACADLKAAGLGVGMVVLAGAGGRAMAGRHVEATTRLLESLPLAKGDLVSVVDASSLADAVADEAISGEECAAQVAALKGRLAGGPKVVAYNPIKRWA